MTSYAASIGNEYAIGIEYQFVNHRFSCDYVGPFEGFMIAWRDRTPDGLQICREPETEIFRRRIYVRIGTVLVDTTRLDPLREFLARYTNEGLASIRSHIRDVPDEPGTLFPDEGLRTGAFVGDISLCSLAIDKGANVNAVGAFAMTAIHWAAAGDRTGVFEWLISCGADIRCTNAFSWDALGLAGANNAKKLRAILERIPELQGERPFTKMLDRWGLNESLEAGKRPSR